MNEMHDLVEAVNAYLERHGHKLKYSKCYPNKKYCYIRTMDYTELEAQIVPMKSGISRVVFKVNGEISSIYK